MRPAAELEHQLRITEKHAAEKQEWERQVLPPPPASSGAIAAVGGACCGERMHGALGCACVHGAQPVCLCLCL